MTARTLLVGALVAGAILPLAFGAAAQTRGAGAAAPAEPPITQGPAIPNVCVWAPTDVMYASDVGQAVFTRLKVLKGQVQAELQPEAEGINAEAKTLQAQQAAMDQATLQARAANLDLRRDNYYKKAQQRNRQLEATQQKQFGEVFDHLKPIIRSLYQQHKCSILLNINSGAITEVNPVMDISGEARLALNQNIKTLVFDLEPPETQPGAAAPSER